MLFNSLEFIFVFLPIVLAMFYITARFGKHQLAIAFLVLSSLFFYGWWKPEYLVLLLFSLLFNFKLSNLIRNFTYKRYAKWALTIGVSVNLGLIAYFKYTNFAIDTLNQIGVTHFGLLDIVLPLGISFFTFQQIAYLVDSYKGLSQNHSFLHYCLFVSFFPQLIAGPIVHYSQVMPQFQNPVTFQFNSSHFSLGLLIFTIGFFKKAVLADSVAHYSNPVFDAADDQLTVTTFESWAGALAYTLQLYFDFSGYSDMAIGLGLMFGIVLPLNFFSPYKSKNIIDFWRRWHMTLSQFLKDYVYIPLGGNRKGSIKRHQNLMITMLVGGLWHGAGWNFVIWGGLHGLYLIVNHCWSTLYKPIHGYIESHIYSVFCIALTFLSVVVAWVFFRAATLDGALRMLSTMFCLNGFSIPLDFERAMSLVNQESVIETLKQLGLVVSSSPGHVAIQDWMMSGIPLIISLMMIAFLCPNSAEIAERFITRSENKYSVNTKALNARPGLTVGFISGIAFFLSVLTFFESTPSEFLYFNF